MFTIQVESDWSVDLVRLIQARDPHLVALLDVTLPTAERLASKGHAEALELHIARCLNVCDDDYVADEADRQTFLRTQLDVDYPATNFDGEREQAEGWVAGNAEALSIFSTEPIPD